MSEAKIKLALAHAQNADIYRQRGELEPSVQEYTRALNIYKELAEEEPGIWGLVAQTIETIAATYKAAGQLDKAQEAAQEAVKLRSLIAQAG